jgi:hypothetical protein
MRRLIVVCFCLMAVCLSGAQNGPDAFQRGAIQRAAGTATVSMNHPDTLLEAIRTVRNEYGWSVSFESAPFYSKYDLVDDTGPKWRAAHPNARGVNRVAGGRFASTFAEFPDMSQPGAEEATLEKIVADYNTSGNPGRYAVQKLDAGVYDIVPVAVKDEAGHDASVQPILDTRISIPIQQRSLYDTVKLILEQLSAKSGKKAIVLGIPVNVFLNSVVTVGGENIPARTMLLNAFAATNRPLIWDLGYDPNVSTYLLNATVSLRSVKGSSGQMTLAPVDR